MQGMSSTGSVLMEPMLEQRPEVEGPGGRPQHDDAGHEAEIAELGDPERLDRGARGRGPVVPVADQQIRAEADQLPEDEHLQKRRRQDEPEHREREQRVIGVVASERGARLVVQVSPRVDLHEQRDQRDQQQHGQAEVVHHHAHGGHRAAVSGQPRPRRRGRLARRAGTALRKSSMAATSAPAMAAMLTPAAAVAERRSGRTMASSAEAGERQPQHDQRQRGRARAHRQPAAGRGDRPRPCAARGRSR